MRPSLSFRRPQARLASREDGYALLLVVFMATILLIGTMEIGLRTLTDGRREKEQDMVWRGKQYTRGIKLYYRKLGRFPNSVDDLVKPKVGSLRFMRQPFTDPMNKDDGSWRLIYVGPAGNLIGSLKPQNNNPLGGASGIPGQSGGSSSFGFGSAGGVTQSAAPGSPTTGFGFSTTGSGNDQSNTNPGASSGLAGATPASGTTTATGTSASGTDSQSIPMGDTPTIVGGNIIGVGSKINKASIMVYEQADNYRLFEFVWNPAKDLGAAIGAGLAPGATQNGTQGQGQGTQGQGAPGQGQSGSQPGQPGQPGFPVNPNPPQMPPTSNPNPNQQQ